MYKGPTCYDPLANKLQKGPTIYRVVHSSYWESQYIYHALRANPLYTLYQLGEGLLSPGAGRFILLSVNFFL